MSGKKVTCACCGMEVDSDDWMCPYCGAAVLKERDKNKKPKAKGDPGAGAGGWAAVLGGAILAGLILWAISRL